MVYLFGLSVAFFLFILILLKKNKTRADYILLSWIGVLVFHLALFNLDYYKVSYQYPHLLGLMLPLPILHGVLLYLYTRELIGKETTLSLKSVMLHLLPFFVLAALAIPFYASSAEEKITVFRNQGRGYEWYSMVQMVFFLISGFGYSAISIWKIRQYRRQAVNTFSNLDRRMLIWLEYLSFGLAVIWLLSTFTNDQIVFGGVVVFVLFIGFFGIHQYPVFYTMPTHEARIATTQDMQVQPTNQAQRNIEQSGSDDSLKYAKSKISEETAAVVMERLEAEMRTREVYRNVNLTLDDVANSIRVSPNHLSQVINTVAGKTFYHYVNTFRIQKFLDLARLPQNRKYTYLGLAYQCGFSSKTTFNKYFKLETGKTPSAYFDSTSIEADAATFAKK